MNTSGLKDKLGFESIYMDLLIKRNLVHAGFVHTFLSTAKATVLYEFESYVR